jgi:hypothetical protein
MSCSELSQRVHTSKLFFSTVILCPIILSVCWVSIEYYIKLQALWQLLWVIPSSSTQKVSPNPSGLKKLSVENVKTRARVGLSELLTQVDNLVLISCYYFFVFFEF